MNRYVVYVKDFEISFVLNYGLFSIGVKVNLLILKIARFPLIWIMVLKANLHDNRKPSEIDFQMFSPLKWYISEYISDTSEIMLESLF